MENRRLIAWSFYFVLLTPLWMFLLWVFTPKRELSIAIVDKTVLTKSGQEHRSFNWLLKYKKFCRPNHDFYSIEHDYYGFFPLDSEKYKLQGLEQVTEQQLEEIPNKYDMTYYTDTYGMYYNEWYKVGRPTERSPHIYGGMKPEDLKVIRKFKEQGKLVICEFNTICSPTGRAVRKGFEQTFKMKWSGWVGRYFDSLDSTVNVELPQWVTRNYRKQHNDQWPFKKSGIVFVREDDHVEVLENQTHLEVECPYILTGKEDQKRYDIVEKEAYPYWFDIMYTSHENHVISVFEIKPNAKGDSILTAYNIPKHFPAAMEHYDTDYKFFYFSGDFADNPIKDYMAMLKGIWYFSPMFYTRGDLSSRNGFFWEYYMPMMCHIMNRYYDDLQDKKRAEEEKTTQPAPDPEKKSAKED